MKTYNRKHGYLQDIINKSSVPAKSRQVMLSGKLSTKSSSYSIPNGSASSPAAFIGQLHIQYANLKKNTGPPFCISFNGFLPCDSYCPLSCPPLSCPTLTLPSTHLQPYLNLYLSIIYPSPIPAYQQAFSIQFLTSACCFALDYPYPCHLTFLFWLSYPKLQCSPLISPYDNF